MYFAIGVSAFVLLVGITALWDAAKSDIAARRHARYLEHVDLMIQNGLVAPKEQGEAEVTE